MATAAPRKSYSIRLTTVESLADVDGSQEVNFGGSKRAVQKVNPKNDGTAKLSQMTTRDLEASIQEKNLTQLGQGGLREEMPRQSCCCCRRRAGPSRASMAQTSNLGSELPDDPTQGHESFLIDEDSAGVYNRHLGRIDCLVRWCCPLRSGNQAAKQQHVVSSHLALISARFFRKAPSKREWTRGLVALRTEAEEEEEEFFEERAPDRAQWSRHHWALDIGVEPPPWSPAAPPLVSIMIAAAHFAQFATGAYGRGMYILMRPLISCLTLGCCTLSDRGAFQRLTGVRHYDVLYSSGAAQPFKPFWWLCIDRASSSIVIAVRGTFGTSDVLSDILARQQEFKGHNLHQGMLLSARWLMGKVLEELREVDEFKSGQYRLVTTGHSLGGGVASILAWLLREDHQDGPCSTCTSYVYGAPLVCDLALAEKMRHFVVHIIHNKDMVPRISMKSMEDLRDRIVLNAESPEERLARYESVLRDLDLPCDPDDLRQALRAGVPERTTPDVSRTSLHSSGDVIADASVLKTQPQFGPGWALHLRRRARTARWREGMPIMRQASLRHFAVAAWTPHMDFFQAVKPATSMWTDHFPQSYLYVCRAYLDGIQKNLVTLPRGVPDGASSAPLRSRTVPTLQRQSTKTGTRSRLEDALADVELYFGGDSVEETTRTTTQHDTGVELGSKRLTGVEFGEQSHRTSSANKGHRRSV